MNDAELTILRNIEAELEKKNSIRLVVPGSKLFARELALRGYKTALLKDGSGWRVYSKNRSIG